MKISSKQYAKSFIGALDGKPLIEQKKLAHRFFTLISQKGDRKHLGAIIREIEQTHFKNLGKKKVVLETSEPAGESLKKEIKKLLGSAVVVEKTNPALLAGIRILINDEILIDASAASQLKKLFRI